MPTDPKSVGWTPRLLLICIGTTVGAVVPIGYALGVMNTPAEVIKEWAIASVAETYGAELNPTNADVLWASIVSIFQVGGILGSFISGTFSNKFGRRGCLLISGCLLICAGLLLGFCRMIGLVEMLLLGRFLIGISTALIYTAQPMYLLECAPIHLRGSAGVFTLLGITGGIVVGQIFSFEQVFGNVKDWDAALDSYLFCVLIGFLPIFWFPESPSWIMNVRQDEEFARASLKSLRGKNADDIINAEIAEIKASAAASSEILSFSAVMKSSELCLPMLIVISFMACQGLSGINGIFFYSVRIFTKCGFSTESAAWMNFGAGVLNFIFALVSFVVMQKFNRRPCMLLSSGACAISLFGLGFALKYIDSVSWFPILCVLLMASFIIFFNFGLGPIPFFIGTELFELPPRSVGMSAGNFSCWTGNFLIGMFFPVVESAIGPFCFLPCGGVCIYCFLLTWRYLPETQRIRPSEVKTLMADGLKSKVT
ncbi:solute carrier family 2, facilitated glucose transporter member 1-like isoform X2 [Anastrepha obliqua]|uniref:solute carrier family 2, facilitated glucose transporter member 1-like isoform X2 n=1 Tax=Anastrepha obliqua TaxID=95512 RepID=UPI00240983D9|nr:solute carrier family 2, facilitated glucose transporter member 1-like isoform X2 [Anastrepha obliqua]